MAMTAGTGTIGVVGTGDMGSAVGGALVRAGYRVVTAGANLLQPGQKVRLVDTVSGPPPVRPDTARAGAGKS